MLVVFVYLFVSTQGGSDLRDCPIDVFRTRPVTGESITNWGICESLAAAAAAESLQPCPTL